MRNKRPHLVEIGAHQIRFHRTAACVHPIDVAAQGVDFAVVREIAVGMRARPARECVRATNFLKEKFLGLVIATLVIANLRCVPLVRQGRPAYALTATFLPLILVGHPYSASGLVNATLHGVLKIQ